VVNIRADGIAVVLGPLLRDVRIVAAALVDVDSGMVLDAWSAAATDATTGSPDLELIGAQHAEIVRTALALLHSWPAGGERPAPARSSSARTTAPGTSCARCRTRSATGSRWRSS